MKKTKNMALAAILTAAGVVILYAGAFLGTIDIASAAVASVSVAVMLGERGYRWAFGVFLAISLLSLVLCVSKTAPIMFTVFFGYYPILKLYSESKFTRLKAYIIKYVFLNVSLVTLIAVTLMTVKLHILIVAAVFVVANILLPLYDIAFNGIMEFYFNNIRKRK